MNSQRQLRLAVTETVGDDLWPGCRSGRGGGGRSRGPSGLGRGVAQAPRRYRGGGVGCADDVEQRLFYPAWATPVAPHVTLLEVGKVTAQLRELEQHIGQKVQRPGVSWTQVGRAVGMSKQGAQQRWGRPQPHQGPPPG